MRRVGLGGGGQSSNPDEPLKRSIHVLVVYQRVAALDHEIDLLEVPMQSLPHDYSLPYMYGNYS